MMFTRLSRFAAGLCLLLCVSPVHAADEYAEIQKLYRQGDRDQALLRLDAHLAAQPRDARARFLKGVILAEQRRTAEAIAVFSELSADFPELAEPYNNLGVLYAGEGNYERARESLEMAVRANPKYATAQENLGDAYAALAGRAYDRAVQLDPKNTSARTKLALTRQVFPADTPASALAAKPESQAAAADSLPPPPPPAVPPSELKTSAPQAPLPSPAEPAQPSRAAESTAPAAPAQAAPAASDASGVLQAVQDWAEAWSRGDADSYLRFYAPDFRPANRQTRAQWEAARRQQLRSAKGVSVTVGSPAVAFSAPDRASVTFRQDYKSDTFKDSASKTLQMVRQGSRWLIQQEVLTRR
jgi:tetratricopeptide (TPR) repeat protein